MQACQVCVENGEVVDTRNIPANATIFPGDRLQLCEIVQIITGQGWIYLDHIVLQQKVHPVDKDTTIAHRILLMFQKTPPSRG